jgi:hypothetical protein
MKDWGGKSWKLNLTSIVETWLTWATGCRAEWMKIQGYVFLRSFVTNRCSNSNIIVEKNSFVFRKRILFFGVCRIFVKSWILRTRTYFISFLILNYWISLNGHVQHLFMELSIVKDLPLVFQQIKSLLRL